MTKVMINPQKSNTQAVTEDDVMFYDIDPVLYGDLFRVQPSPSSEWQWFRFSAFAAWLQDAGRIDHHDNDQEYICVYGCGSSYQNFFRDLAISREGDKLIAEYATGNKPLGEPLSPSGLTADQEEAAWAYFYGMYDETFTHPNAR